MEVYLIRHTEPDISKGICYGNSDIPLKTSCEDEFNAIASCLKLDKPLIYSSPLSRCRQLAEHYQKHHQLSSDIFFDTRLKEMNFGDWELQNWNAIEPVALNVWMNDFVNEKTPNGESFTELYARTNEFIESELLAKKHTAPVVIFTHAGIIRSFLSRILEIPLKNAFNLSIDYAGISKIQFYGEDNAFSKIDFVNRLY